VNPRRLSHIAWRLVGCDLQGWTWKNSESLGLP